MALLQKQQIRMGASKASRPSATPRVVLCKAAKADAEMVRPCTYTMG